MFKSILSKFCKKEIDHNIKESKDKSFHDVTFLQDDFVVKNFNITFIRLESQLDPIYTYGFVYNAFLYSYIFRNNRYDFDGIYIVDDITGGERTSKYISRWYQILDSNLNYTHGNWDEAFKQNLESLKKLIQEKKMKIILDDDRQTQDNRNYFDNKFPPSPPLRPKSRELSENFIPPFTEN